MQNNGLGIHSDKIWLLPKIPCLRYLKTYSANLTSWPNNLVFLEKKKLSLGVVVRNFNQAQPLSKMFCNFVALAFWQTVVRQHVYKLEVLVSKHFPGGPGVMNLWVIMWFGSCDAWYLVREKNHVANYWFFWERNFFM